MASEWFYQVMGEQVGPLSSAELLALAQRGSITYDTPVRKGTNGNWGSAARVKGLPFATHGSIGAAEGRDSHPVVFGPVNDDGNEFWPSEVAARSADSQVPLVLEGRQGNSVIARDGTITIVKEAGVFSSRREKVLPIRNITSVEVKRPGPFVVGFIQFSIAGGQPRNSSYTWTGGAFDAVQDENSVVFGDDTCYRMAMSIKSYVEQYSQADGQGTPVSFSIADEIAKLKRLADEGVLTREEFEAKKKQLLGT
jgi:hypothetical protein